MPGIAIGVGDRLSCCVGPLTISPVVMEHCCDPKVTATFGHTVSVQLLGPGLIVLLFGTDCVKFPLLSRVPEIVGGSGPPGHEAFVGPTKVKLKVPLLHTTPPESLTDAAVVTMVEFCAFKRMASRRSKAAKSIFLIV